MIGIGVLSFILGAGGAIQGTASVAADTNRLRPVATDTSFFISVPTTIRFDVIRDTPEALAKYRAQRHLDGNWILLHGDGGSVRELAALLGVQYRETADGAFTHSNQIVVLNPEGEIVHERKGLQGGLDEAASAIAQNSK